MTPPAEYEDDKISLPFVVTDLRGRSLKPLRERATAQVGGGPGGALGVSPPPRGGCDDVCVSPTACRGST